MDEANINCPDNDHVMANGNVAGYRRWIKN